MGIKRHHRFIKKILTEWRDGVYQDYSTNRMTVPRMWHSDAEALSAQLIRHSWFCHFYGVGALDATRRK